MAAKTKGPGMVTENPEHMLLSADLEALISSLHVDFVNLTECVVSKGWRLSFAGNDRPGIHYNITGHGQVRIGRQPPVPIAPHTLIIVPPRQSFTIEAAGRSGHVSKTAVRKWETNDASGTLQRAVAGNGRPHLLMICGYFQAGYGGAVDVFSSLQLPLMQTFEDGSGLHYNLKSALKELHAQEVGMNTMTSALLKQVLIMLFRQSLKSPERTGDAFPLLRDARIAQAIAAMVAEPAAEHTVELLAQKCGLSRSGFMARFSESVGDTPMVVLRRLRLRKAAELLRAKSMSVEQVASVTGYRSRNGFSRAFRKAYGFDPAQYRAAAAST